MKGNRSEDFAEVQPWKIQYFKKKSFPLSNCCLLSPPAIQMALRDKKRNVKFKDLWWLRQLSLSPFLIINVILITIARTHKAVAFALEISNKTYTHEEILHFMQYNSWRKRRKPLFYSKKLDFSNSKHEHILRTCNRKTAFKVGKCHCILGISLKFKQDGSNACACTLSYLMYHK